MNRNDIKELQDLEKILSRGAFDISDDRCLALLSSLGRHLEELPAVADLLDQLAMEQSWEEKVRADMLADGIFNPDMLDEGVESMEGDEDDEFLLDRSASLRDYTEMARALFSDPDVKALMWMAGFADEVDDGVFTHGPTRDLSALIEQLPSQEKYVVVGKNTQGITVLSHRVFDGRVVSGEPEADIPAL